MKKYKDIDIYDFSDYAEEITGEDLIKINGGSSSCNGGGPGNGGSSIKIKLVQKELDHQFALAVSSYIGTDYVFGGKSRKGIDCSGTITESLKDMGYRIENKSVSNMVNGKVDWLSILPYHSEKIAGNEESYPVVQARINWEVLDEKYHK